MTDTLPATFADLTEMQANFVRYYVETGGRDASLAARLAGYSTKADGHRVIAHRLLRDPRILAALRQEVETKVRAGAALAMGTLIELAEKASTDGVRFQAAQAVLDRAGLLVAKTSEHTITIKDERTAEQIIQNIRRLAANNGIDLSHVPGLSAPAVDAEYEEVEPMSAEGLEDLL
jgi:phage terminase small subunit